MRWFVAFLSTLVAVGFILLPVACGSSSTNASGPADAGAEATSVDAGQEAQGPVGFPAYPPDMPSVLFNKGTVLKTAKFVTVTWNGDPNVLGYESLGDTIGQSDYWKKTTSEYGVGPATGGGHVHIMDPPPATIADDDITTFVAQNLENVNGPDGGSGWPAADENTVYVLYMPVTTKVTTQGENACGFYGGYHNETFITGNSHVLFAVVLQQCAMLFGGDAYSQATTTASHEMIEAATDPHAQSDNGWVGLDQTHYSWDTWLQGQTELADMCEAFDAEEYRDPFGFVVQRSWSNASAIAGHDPCVPAPETPYFNVTPLDLEDITISPLKGKGGTKTKGYTIPVGTTKTIRLGFYSDAAFPAWDFNVQEGGGFAVPMETQTTINVKKTVGGNGDVAEVDVTVNKLIGPDSSILLTAISHAPNTVVHFMPILISGK